MSFLKDSIVLLAVSCVLGPWNVQSSKFSALTDEHYLSVSRMYFEESSSDGPHPSDPALNDPDMRKQICEEVTNSGAFARYALHPLADGDEREIRDNITRSSDDGWTPPEGLDILSQIYNPEYPFAYTNLFHFREVDVNKFITDEIKPPILVPKTESVFVCLLKNKDFTRLFPVFVSKEYDVNGSHRFAFLKYLVQNVTEPRMDDALLIVEKSAEIFQAADFNPEVHYANIRQQRRPAATARYDPVCTKNRGPLEYDQFFRLCAIIFTAPYFKEKIKVAYPRRVHYSRHFEKLIAFRTEAGLRAAERENIHKAYFERTLECHVRMQNGPDRTWFVSRAYNSHHVFVYFEQNRMLYLEGLFTGVGIVHEKNNFGFMPTDYN